MRVVQAMVVCSFLAGCVPIGDAAFARRLGLCASVTHDLGFELNTALAGEVDGDGVADLVAGAWPPAVNVVQWDGAAFGVTSTITEPTWDGAPVILDLGEPVDGDTLIAVDGEDRAFWTCSRVAGAFTGCAPIATDLDLNRVEWAPRGRWTGGTWPDLMAVSGQVYRFVNGTHVLVGGERFGDNTNIDQWASYDFDEDGYDDLILIYEDLFGRYLATYRGDEEVGLVEAAKIDLGSYPLLFLADLDGTGHKRIHLLDGISWDGAESEVPLQLVRLDGGLESPSFVDEPVAVDRVLLSGPPIVVDVDGDGIDDVVSGQGGGVFADFGYDGGLGVTARAPSVAFSIQGAADLTGDGTVDFYGQDNNNRLGVATCR